MAGDSHCGACDEVDNMEMVRCDKCDTWFHFSCVGVTQAVQDIEWMCTACQATSTTEKAPSVTNVSTSSSQRRRRLLEFQKLEEERALDVEREKHRERREREREKREKEKEQREAEKARRDREYIKKKYDLLVDGGSDDELNADKGVPTEFMRKTNDWLRNTFDLNVLNEPFIVPPGTAPRICHNPPTSTVMNPMRSQVGQPPVPPATTSSTWLNRGMNSMCSQGAQPPPPPVVTSSHPSMFFQQPREQWRQPQMTTANNPFPPVAENVNIQNFWNAPGNCLNVQPTQLSLNASHIAARQVTAKELPIFGGRPEEWPMFISSYETSTNACGFSDTENMMRLQRCLKGSALEAVRSKLLLPTMVAEVIGTLKMLYGRPELIIYSMLEKVRSEPSPKADKLESLIAYALSVQNLCAMMEASGLVAHLCNPSLLQELTNKLPPQIRLNWAIYKQNVPAVNLSTFGSWLFQLAKAASKVTMMPLMGPSSEGRNERRRQSAEKEFLHSHSEEPSGPRHRYSSQRNSVSRPSPGDARVGTPRRCHGCDQNCQNVSECPKFKALPHPDKWNLVRLKRLCRKCLGPHDQYKCKRDVLCGQDGCLLRHHPLLHNAGKPGPKPEEARPEACYNHQMKSPQVLFRVVPVTLYGKDASVRTFAFLDEGSSSTLIEDELADDLGLQGTRENLCLKWTAHVIRVEKNSRRIALDISGNGESYKRYHLKSVRTVERLNLPMQTVIAHSLVAKYPHLDGIPLEDYVNATPRIIIGMVNCKLGLNLDYREGADEEPVATKT